MELTDQDVQRLAHDGMAALQTGRFDDARTRFETAAKSGRGGAQILQLLALACKAQGDSAAEEEALDQWLALEPQAVVALIMKGHCRADAGAERTAATLFKTALRLGSEQSLPQPVLAELQGAETRLIQLEARYGLHLESALASQGFPPGGRSARFQQSLDIIAGRKQVYFQEPTVYFFPELPQIQYYDPALFAWASQIEAATDVIREELKVVLAEGLEGFRPYIRSEADQPRDHPLLDKTDWSALFLAENGVLFDEAIARCPKTWEALQAASLPRIPGAAPTAMFSLLRPGTRIPAHTGVQNTRLTCHLPLIVPSGCGFRVGNEVRAWKEGKLLIFDDTIQHEAWNNSGEDRVVLIFDIWRPELNETEQREVAALFSIPDIEAGAAG